MSGLSEERVLTMTMMIMMAPVLYCVLFNQSIGGLEHDFLSPKPFPVRAFILP